MTIETLALFDLTPAGLPAPPAPDLPCIWHRGRGPESTHRVVSAIDLLHPKWWQWGGIRPDGSLQSAGGGPLRLHRVGAGVCTPCAERDAGVGDELGIVRHYAPLPPRRSAPQETEQR